jgi:hypothetical protein
VLSAVRLLDHAVNVQRSEDGHCPFVVRHYNSIAARRDVGVIHRWDGIFLAIRGPNGERDKRDPMQLFSNLIDHSPTLYQKLSVRVRLLVVEPDVEIAADVVHVGFELLFHTG